MKHLFSLSLLLSISLQTISQAEYQSGHYINNANQKIDILVLEQNWDFTPQKFTVKHNSNSASETLLMDNIQELQIGELKFKKYQVEIDRSSEFVKDMSDQANPIFNKESLMLQVVVEGDPSLYYFNDNTGVERFFYTYQDAPPQQLVYKSYRYDAGIIPGSADMESTIRINRQYRQQLLNAFSNLGINNTGVQNLDYIKSDMRWFFQDLNRRNKTKAISYKDTQKSLLADVRFKGGPFWVKGSAASTDAFNMTGVGVASTYNAFTAALEIEVLLNIKRKFLGFFVEPSFYKYESSVFLDTGDPLFDKTLNFTNMGIEINLGAKGYVYSQNELDAFIKLGYAAHFEDRDSFFKYDPSERLWDNLPSTMLIAAGLEYKIFSLEYRYYSNRKVSDRDLDTQLEYQRSSIMFGVKIF